MSALGCSPYFDSWPMTSGPLLPPRSTCCRRKKPPSVQRLEIGVRPGRLLRRRAVSSLCVVCHLAEPHRGDPVRRHRSPGRRRQAHGVQRLRGQGGAVPRNDPVGDRSCRALLRGARRRDGSHEGGLPRHPTHRAPVGVGRSSWAGPPAATAGGERGSTLSRPCPGVPPTGAGSGPARAFGSTAGACRRRATPTPRRGHRCRAPRVHDHGRDMDRGMFASGAVSVARVRERADSGASAFLRAYGIQTDPRPTST